MPRSETPRRGRSTSARWHKQFLLPMPDELISRCALESHLALVGGGVEGGLKDALIKLIRLTYLSFFLWEAGCGGEQSDFLEAERALDTAVNRAVESGLWQLNEEEHAVVRRVVCEHDRQLHAVSMRAYLEATKRLELLLGRPHTDSPIRERFRDETVSISSQRRTRNA